MLGVTAAGPGLVLQGGFTYWSWQAMDRHAISPMQVAFRFQRSHRIPDMDLDIPAVKILPGPMQQARVASCESSLIQIVVGYDHGA